MHAEIDQFVVYYRWNNVDNVSSSISVNFAFQCFIDAISLGLIPLRGPLVRDIILLSDF